MNRTTGWIIYPRYVASHGDNAFSWLTREAALLDIQLDVVFLEDLLVEYTSESALLFHMKSPVHELPGFVIIRAYSSVISRFFESRGVPVINSSHSMELCKNKMLTHEILSRASVPTPATVYHESAEYDYSEICSLLGAPHFIVKRIDGTKGEDVYLVKSPHEMKEAVERCAGRCICQQFIEESFGKDVRVWTIGDKAAGAVLRYSDSSFLSNFSQGGMAAAFDLPEEAARLAGQCARLLGVQFAGIDLLFGPKGFVVNEVNGNAGFRTLSKVGRNEIPRLLFTYIREKFC